MMILLKMGGSVITDKSRPLAASRDKIAAMAKAVARIKEPVIIVHGGGSFGHYWSVKYDMHSAVGEYDTEGVSEVKNSMVQLDMIILEELRKSKVKPYVIAPSGFMSDTTTSPVKSRIMSVKHIAETSDMTPVTYGDALHCKKRDGGTWTYILSGDRIMSHMARILSPRLCIFALGEDGLYENMETKKIIKRIEPDMLHGITRRVDKKACSRCTNSSSRTQGRDGSKNRDGGRSHGCHRRNDAQDNRICTHSLIRDAGCICKRQYPKKDTRCSNKYRKVCGDVF